MIVPAYNAAHHLGPCLEALCRSTTAFHEIIVVDDGSTDETPGLAARYDVTVLHTGGRRGPAFARNLGANAASGEILLFIDADVSVRHDTGDKIRTWFASDAELAALIGSYDSEPRCPDFLSQYRNLMHHFVHQNGGERASTFWSGCGAIRRDIFLEYSGFSEAFGRPAIEDIELGYRLVRAGCKIVLDRDIQVTHAKRWTFWNLVRTDVLDRGIPWTELILRDQRMPDDLNLQLSQRVSVALVFILVALSGMLAVLWRGYFLVPLIALVFLLLTRWWGEFGHADRPQSAPLVLLAVVALIIGLAWWHGMVGLIPPLVLSPGLLLLQHRYSHYGSRPKALRWLAALYTCASIALAVYYMPHHPVVLAGFTIFAVLGLLNSQFYLFLAAKRGIPFMLAAVPFHMLYHFYNGISFLAGLVLHLRLMPLPAARRDWLRRLLR